MQIKNNNSINDKEEWERVKAKGKSRFILGKAVVYAITSSLIGLLISIFSPDLFSITVWAVIVIACTIGGYTSAKWKWSYYKQRYTKND